MNTDQLLCAIRENRCLSSMTDTVYSADTLPRRVNTYPAAFICNTDQQYLPGKHWILFWFQDAHHSECYDSLGQLPGTYYHNFDLFLQRNTTKCVYNNEPLQKEGTDTCGYHVLFYLLMKCRSIPLIKIVRQLKQWDSSDQFVIDYVTHQFRCL